MPGTDELNTALTVAGATTAIFVYLVALLRITGNRTLSGLRAFDFLVTIAIGTLVGSAAVQGTGVTLFKAVVAVTVLIVLQVIVASLSVRSDAVNNLVTSPPRLLFYEGRFLGEQLQKARTTTEQVEMQVRASGIEDLGRVKAVVLETNGEMSVVPKNGGSPADERSSLSRMRTPEGDGRREV